MSAILNWKGVGASAELSASICAPSTDCGTSPSKKVPSSAQAACAQPLAATWTSCERSPQAARGHSDPRKWRTVSRIPRYIGAGAGTALRQNPDAC